MTEQMPIYITQGLILLLMFLIIVLLLRQNKAIRLEKRIGKFTIKTIKDHEKSFFDIVEKKYLTFLKKLRPLFLRIKFLKNYSDKYQSHIKTKNQIFNEPIDYFINKIIIGFGIMISYLLTEIIQSNIPSFLIAILSFVIGFYFLDFFLKYKEIQYKKQIKKDLLKAIIIIGNAFKGGKTTLQAIEMAKEQLPYPIKDEFEKIYLDLTFGMSVETTFERFAARVKLAEVKYISSSLTILNKTGGNIITVFDSIEKTLFNNVKLEEELKNLTASPKLVIKTLMIFPLVIIIGIVLLNPSYFLPFFKEINFNGKFIHLGYFLMGIMTIMFATYLFLLNKIMKVKV